MYFPSSLCPDLKTGLHRVERKIEKSIEGHAIINIKTVPP
jgi:hypothetical protein